MPAAKAMLNLLSEGIAAANPLAPSLRAAVAQLRKQSDYYITHEYLEAFNNPCYLLEFVNLADQYALAHVSDAEPQIELGETYGPDVRLNHSLVAMGRPREVRQQYLDFATGRNFRKSLLVHQARMGEILLAPDLDRAADLRCAGFFTETEAPAQVGAGMRFFKNHRGQPLHSNDAVVLAVLPALSAAWPDSLDFDALQAATAKALPQDAGEARKALLTALQTLFRLNMLRYALEPLPGRPAAEANEAPALMPGFLAIFDARRDPAFGVGTFNRWHETVSLTLTDAETWLLPRIDGRNTRKQLVILLRDALSQGLVPDNDGQSLKGQRNLDQKAATLVKNLLDLLRRQALLC